MPTPSDQSAEWPQKAIASSESAALICAGKFEIELSNDMPDAISPM